MAIRAYLNLIFVIWLASVGASFMIILFWFSTTYSIDKLLIDIFICLHVNLMWRSTTWMHSWWVETNSTLSSQPHQFLMEIHTDTIFDIHWIQRRKMGQRPKWFSRPFIKNWTGSRLGLLSPTVWIWTRRTYIDMLD